MGTRKAAHFLLQSRFTFVQVDAYFSLRFDAARGFWMKHNGGSKKIESIPT